MKLLEEIERLQNHRIHVPESFKIGEKLEKIDSIVDQIIKEFDLTILNAEPQLDGVFGIHYLVKDSKDNKFQFRVLKLNRKNEYRLIINPC